ncbi:hypothetical protein GCM10010174_88510 [Kutzneria viridogrisea]|uniref:WYL domain-containing protein n=1 Tax=Kutzneria viridogrisea TaxID=47990 RepID=A0ABR6BJT9_9PSEU|nr:hypothetical protein [Kutzneria viridogrisea]
MSAPPLESYRAAAAALTPPAVSQYLATHGWVLESRRDDIKEIWRLPEEDHERPRGRIMLPLATDYADFPQRFNDVLYSLGCIYGWDAAELSGNILAARADRFFVRLNQTMADETIPFRQAEQTIEALYKLLKAAATTAADPHHSHRGKRPAGVTAFLEDDVRLGHTRRGSFVFTVVARLGDPNATAQAPGGELTVFPRRVMETLARGLESTEELSRRWDPRALESAAEHGLSASLVESIEDMTQLDQLRSVDLSFEWAAAGPHPTVGLSPIVFDREAIAGLPRVRERLVRKEEPPRRGTLVGTVRSLTRESTDSDSEEVASIVLSADVGGKVRSVHVSLSGDDHNWAIVAYQRKLPFTVTGDLVYERRAWRLTGDIEVDASFLRHYTS